VSLILRIVRVGLAAAVLVGLIGFGVERSRFGPSDQSALNRVEAELRQRFDASAATLGTIAARIAAEPDTARVAPRDPAGLKRLFDIVAAAVPDDEGGRTGVTIYDALGTPLAWAGRASDLGKGVVLGAASLIVAPGPLGPGLIRIEPVSRAGVRAATVVVEQALGIPRGAPGLSETFVMPTLDRAGHPARPRRRRDVAGAALPIHRAGPRRRLRPRGRRLAGGARVGNARAGAR